ncbi:Cobalamin synthase [Lachnospiraceae bacterium TWA4]|nr:Cobalamin synthase [Lachnospiraceae bacterium TWA4]
MLKNLWSNFLVSMAMHSKVPVPHIDWNEDNMKYTMCFFPLVGAIEAALMILWYYLSAKLGFGLNFTTAIYLLIPVLVTGGLHLDGLLDASDALSSWQTMERRLEIMKDSNSGAFAVITCTCYFVLAFGTWSEMNFEALKILAVVYVFSRSFSGMSIVAFKKARKTGLAVAFSTPAQKNVVKWTMIAYMIICSALMLYLNPILGLTAILTTLAVFGYYRYMSYKYFGGTTGDLCGFFVQVCELATAIAVVVVGKFL